MSGSFLPKTRGLAGLAVLGVSMALACPVAANPIWVDASALAAKPAPLPGGLHINKLRYDEEREHFGLAMPLPFLPQASYNRDVFTTKNRHHNWRNGGVSDTVRFKLPYGMVLSAGRSEHFSGGPMGLHRQDEFIGLTFSSAHYRNSGSVSPKDARGVDRGAPIPDYVKKRGGIGVFVGTYALALAALLASGDDGGGGGVTTAAPTTTPTAPTTPTSPSVTPSDEGWELVWSDEFTGSTLDTSKWSATDSYGRDQCFGGGNNEQQCYTTSTQNVSVAGGKLVLTARPATGLSQGRTYTSGRVQSNGKGDFTYGKFEASIKLPTGQGSWPAFWMLPSQNSVDWPSRGEIDIMEAVNLGGNGGSTIHGTAHWGDPHTYLGGSSNLPNLSEFHTYTVEWYPDEIRWLLNGNQYYRLRQNQWFSSDAPNDANAPFDRDFHMILNFAVGGQWPGNSDGTNFPRQMEVDYVRVYECEGSDPTACK